MDIDHIYQKYLKRASKDNSDKRAMDKSLFFKLWDLSDVFRREIVEYIKETEKL